MIALNDIFRFYKAKDINADCPVCGEEKWAMVSPPNDNSCWAFVSEKLSGKMSLLAPALPVLILACENCYHLRNHALKPIEEWLNDNPEQAENHEPN